MDFSKQSHGHIHASDIALYYHAEQSESQISALARAIESLPEIERVVISLLLYELLDTDEVGAMLALTREQVRQIYVIARGRIEAFQGTRQSLMIRG